MKIKLFEFVTKKTTYTLEVTPTGFTLWDKSAGLWAIDASGLSSKRWPDLNDRAAVTTFDKTGNQIFPLNYPKKQRWDNMLLEATPKKKKRVRK